MGSQRVRVAAVSDVKPGDKKAFDFAGSGDDAPKVLLSNLNGKIYGTSAKCTHYGAPLANGVLTAEGRVVCPWHGACFNVKTGDIEDAPGLDALVSVKVEIEGEDVYVTADPEQLKGKPGVAPGCAAKEASSSSSGAGLVIVGGGAGAIHLIEAARKAGYAAPITLLTNEPHAPIDRTKLSKGLVADAGAVTWRSPAHLKNVLRVDLRTGAEVASVDAAAKKVHTAAGDAVAFDTLVLATGGTPRWLPVPGAKQGQLGNVFVLRGLAHVQALLKALGDAGDKDVVVVGSSFIGCEAAIALVGQKKAKSVTVVGMESQPFERVLGKDVGAGLRAAAEKNQGIKFYMQAGVEALQNANGSSDGGDVSKVVIKDEKGQKVELKADVVLLGVGVAPATEYLKSSAGFALQKDGSLLVDDAFRVKDAPAGAEIYAIGDIATTRTRDGSSTIRIEHWNVASNQGRHVGEALAKGTTPRAESGGKFDKLPVFWSALGSQLRYVSDGNGGQFDSVHIDGDVAALKFVAYYAKGDKVTAVASMGRDPLVMQSSELLRLGKMPSFGEVKGGKDPLAIAAA